jgi:hypothetical protein
MELRQSDCLFRFLPYYLRTDSTGSLNASIPQYICLDLSVICILSISRLLSLGSYRVCFLFCLSEGLVV